MAYGHGEWEFDLFRQTREFVRLHAVVSGEAAEARDICEQFTHLIQDDWQFEAHPGVEGSHEQSPSSQ